MSRFLFFPYIPYSRACPPSEGIRGIVLSSLIRSLGPQYAVEWLNSRCGLVRLIFILINLLWFWYHGNLLLVHIKRRKIIIGLLAVLGWLVVVYFVVGMIVFLVCIFTDRDVPWVFFPAGILTALITRFIFYIAPYHWRESQKFLFGDKFLYKKALIKSKIREIISVIKD